MSLINCPECGNEMSTNAKICPKCGYRKKGFALGLVSMCIAIFSLFIKYYPLILSLFIIFLTITAIIIGVISLCIKERLKGFGIAGISIGCLQFVSTLVYLSSW